MFVTNPDVREEKASVSGRDDRGARGQMDKIKNKTVIC